MHSKETLLEYTLGCAPAGFATTTTATTVINSTNDHYAIIFRAPETRNIDEVFVFINAVTGSPTLTVGIMDIAASGLPDGTYNTSATFTGAAGGAWRSIGGTQSLTKGTAYAIVVRGPASGDATMVSYSGAILSNFPYVCEEVDGGGFSRTADLIPIWGGRLASDTTDVFGVPFDAAFSAATQATTSGHRVARKLVIPASFGRRVKCNGFRILGLFTGDYVAGIWDASGAVVTTGTINHDESGVAGGRCFTTAYWDAVWLETNTTYYLGYQATGAAIAMYSFNVDTVGDLSAYPGYPNNTLFTYNGSTWSEQTARGCAIGRLLISDWDKHGQDMHDIETGRVR